MALFYPDILEHNNPNNPLMDDGQLAGSLRIVADKTARNSIPLDKRKVGALVNWTENSVLVVKKYAGSDVTDLNWQDDANWVDINHPFFSTDIRQTLLANSTTTFVIGNKLIFGSIFLYYQMIRGDSVAMGQIDIVQNGVVLESPVFFTLREINDVGLVAITSAYNSNDIEVSIEIDGSSASDVLMTYNMSAMLLP